MIPKSQQGSNILLIRKKRGDIKTLKAFELPQGKFIWLIIRTQKRIKFVSHQTLWKSNWGSIPKSSLKLYFGCGPARARKSRRRGTCVVKVSWTPQGFYLSSISLRVPFPHRNWRQVGLCNIADASADTPIPLLSRAFLGPMPVSLYPLLE
jgi:hypothetical protein